jgi:hypothetical protein
LVEEVTKARLAPLPLGREVGPDVERLAVGREPRRQRPPATPGDLLADAHVDAVEVGPFLPVDLDGNEVLVQRLRDGLVLEALLLHDVTPVTGGVADGEEDWGVPLLCGV